MEISGKKMGTLKALKDSLKKGGSSLNTFIKNVPAEGITVRFLTEPEEWFGYYEYWNDESRNFCPMAVGEVLPDGSRPSFRYLTCAVDIESDRVIPLKLAKTAANSLILKYDKYGTMLDRNYELQRHGEGLDTSYDVTPDAPSKLSLAKYDTIDLEKVLVEARANALGEQDTEPRKSKPPVIDNDEIDNEDDTNDEDAEEILFPSNTYREDYTESELQDIVKNFNHEVKNLLETWEIDETLVGKSAVRAILKAQKDKENNEDEDVETDEDNATDSYDKETLDAMSLRDIKLIAEDLEIDVAGMPRNLLIEAIIDANEK